MGTYQRLGPLPDYGEQLIQHTLTKSLPDYMAYQEREGEKKRVLHPAVQHFLQKVLSGEMTPEQAAALAHGHAYYGIDPTQGGAAPQGAAPAADPSAGGPPSAVGPGLAAAGLGGQAQPSLGLGTLTDPSDLNQVPVARQATAHGPMLAEPVTGGGLSSTQRPLTSQDLDDATKIAPFHRSLATDTPEDRMARALLAARTRIDVENLGNRSQESITDRRIGSTEERTKADRDQRDRFHNEKLAEMVASREQRWKETLAKLSVAFRIAQNRTGSQRDVELMKAALSDVKGAEGEASRELTSINSLAGDPDTKARAAQVLTDMKTRRQFLESKIKEVEKNAGQPQPGGSSSSVTGRTPAVHTAESLNNLFGVGK